MCRRMWAATVECRPAVGWARSDAGSPSDAGWLAYAQTGRISLVGRKPYSTIKPSVKQAGFKQRKKCRYFALIGQKRNVRVCAYNRIKGVAGFSDEFVTVSAIEEQLSFTQTKEWLWTQRLTRLTLESCRDLLS